MPVIKRHAPSCDCVTCKPLALPNATFFLNLFEAIPDEDWHTVNWRRGPFSTGLSCTGHLLAYNVGKNVDYSVAFYKLCEAAWKMSDDYICTGGEETAFIFYPDPMPETPKARIVGACKLLIERGY